MTRAQTLPSATRTARGAGTVTGAVSVDGGGYLRISEDPFGQEKGVTRQKEDVTALAAREGVRITRWYIENDTSAFKKRKIKLPSGRLVWRVIRPEFRRMLEDYEDGLINAVIVYDLDRLARQPRDLEDLIDLVEYRKRPVMGVTGSIDLMTSGGRAMARVLVAMANKSSEDTARRVARAHFQTAKEGKHVRYGPRPFGWKGDRLTLEPAEAKMIRAAAKQFLAGESWTGLVHTFIQSGIPTVTGGKWALKTIRQMLTSPRVAGLIMYNGQFHPDHQTGSGLPNYSRKYLDPKSCTLRDDDGEYVKGPWKPILTVAQWEAVLAEIDRRATGRGFTGSHTRKHLLTGLLRCGRTLPDGTRCNRSLYGVNIKGRYDTTIRYNVYRCPAPSVGGCGGIERKAQPVEELIEELLIKHLREHAPAGVAEPEERDLCADEIAATQERVIALRDGFTNGTVTQETFFAVLPSLEARLKTLRAEQSKQHHNRHRSTPAETALKEWPDATLSRKRAILGDYLHAIIVHPARRQGGRFDHNAIEPIWKD